MNIIIMNFKTAILVSLALAFTLLGNAQSPGSGYAIDFDGTNDKITIPYTSAISGLTTELTIEFWVKPTSTSIAASYAGLVCKYFTGADTSNSFVCDMESGVFKFMIRQSNNTEVWLNTSFTATADTWHHVALTADGSNLKAYINGVQKGSSVSYDGTIEQASRITTIGTYRNDDSWGVADVTMDEVRIWKKGLSQATIRDWMCRKVTSSHANYSDLNAYYKFDENTGTSAYDSSGTNNATLTNGPSYVLSGAAIGNESTSSYGSGNSTAVTETHSDGSSFKIDNFTGTPDGAHVYLVNAAPNSTTESLSGALDSTRYYGTYVVGGTSPTHTFTYDYTGNTNITGGTESQAVLTSRADNSTSSWTKESNSNQVDVSTDVITKCGVSSNKEYAAGFDNELQERPGSGYALTFDGSDDYVTIPNTTATTPGTELTVEAWIKPDANQTGSIAMKGNYGWGFYIAGATGCSTGNQLNYWVDGSCANTIASTGTLTNGEWNHVAVVVTTSPSKTLAFYINGVAAGTSTNSSITIGSGSNGSIYVGRQGSACSCSYFDGSMDELRVWNKALSQAEIQAGMCKKVNSTDANYCDLGAYLRYDENTGSTAYDYSGNSDGTLTNSPTYALSGAAIGDESAYSYGSGNSIAVTETHSDGSSFKIDNFTGTPDGAHVYLVNEAPNSTSETLSGALESTRYYGTFVVGGTSPTHSVTYDYTGNTNITGGTETQAVLTSRAENATSNWTQLTNSFNLNTSTDVITKCNISANQEYAGGFNAVLPESPGSGYDIYFNGFVSYVDVGDLGLTSGTICMWIKPDNTTDDLRLWSQLTGATSQAGSVALGNADNDIEVWSGSSWLKLVDNSASFAGEWHHLAVVYSGGSATAYWDGVQKSTVTTGFAFNGVSMGLGADFLLTHGNRYKGFMDEVSIWNTSLTQAEIRSLMCQKITSSHSKFCNIQAYYRFDENSGITANNYAGGNNGTLKGPSYDVSEAPIGDESTNSYGSGNSTSVTETHTDGSSFKIDNFTGTPDGAHVYLVNEAPNSTIEALSGALETSRYYGMFIVGGTSPTHSVTHNYTGNTNITGGTESEAVLTHRADNSETSWNKWTTNYDLNTNTDVITKGNVSTKQEFAVGFDAILQERPGSGYALDFDGTNDFVTIPNTIEQTATTELTIEAWVYRDVANAYHNVLMKGNYGYGMIVDNSNKLGYWSNSNYGLCPTAGTVPSGVWTHLAITVVQNSLTTFYINGVNVGSSSSAGHTTVNNGGLTNSYLYLGLQGVYFTNYFNGKMDEVKVWNKALSQTEIRDWMCKKITTSHPKYNNLVTYHRFDENSGSFSSGYTGGVSGTITGPTYALSGAPIGDDAAYDTSVTSSTTLSLAHADGPQMNVDVTSGTADVLALYRVDEAPNVTTPPSGLTEVSHSHYYGVKAFGSSSLVYEVEYNYNGHDRLAGKDEDSLKLCSRADNSTASWTKTAATLNTTSNTLTLGGQTGTQFIMGSANQFPLPIELTAFYAKRQNESVELNWTTESETNNDYFNIEGSPNGSEWVELARINGAGNSSSRLTYRWKDLSPYPRENYYRLKQVDTDGQMSFSRVVRVDFNEVGRSTLKVYPNPTSKIIFIESNQLEIGKISLFNLLGDNLSKEALIKVIDSHKISIDLSSLDVGLFILHVGENKYKVYKN